MSQYNANVGHTSDQRYAPPGMPAGVLASPAKRLGAHVIDMILPFCLLLGVGGMGWISNSAGIVGLLTLAYIVWAIILFSHGTTPGKNMLGMDVVDEDGRPATFWRMLLREWVGKFISGVVFGLGYLWILIDKDRQGWHDKLASTYVVVRPFRD